MKLEFPGAKLNVVNPNNINEKSTVSVFTGNIGGKFSHGVDIQISVPEATSYDVDGWVSVTLNRNQARYLIKFLSAFVNEKDIDIEDED